MPAESVGQDSDDGHDGDASDCSDRDELEPTAPLVPPSSNDSGAAGDRKGNGFQLKSFRKASILSVGPGRERLGIEKSTDFN